MSRHFFVAYTVSRQPQPYPTDLLTRKAAEEGTASTDSFSFPYQTVEKLSLAI